MSGTATTGTILCQSLGTLIMSIYCLAQGVNYPTPGGCTSLDNGDLPNQTGLDMGWWFEVYGAVGLTAALLTICAGLMSISGKEGQEGAGTIGGCAVPLNCTILVFFVMGNVWFFYFTPSTTWSDGGSSGNTSGTSGTNVVNGGGSGTMMYDLAGNCQWLSQNGYYIMLTTWILFAVGCCCGIVVGIATAK